MPKIKKTNRWNQFRSVIKYMTPVPTLEQQQRLYHRSKLVYSNDEQWSMFLRDVKEYSHPFSQKKDKDTKADTKTKQYVVSEWETKYLAKKKPLTIKDIIHLKPGTKVQLLCVHRNVYDIPSDLFTDLAVPAKLFFRQSKCIYTHHKDLQGTLEWIHDPNWGRQQPFEFDLLVEELGLWVPLFKGAIPTITKKDDSRVLKTFVTRPWRDFANMTPVGMRGYFYRWSVLDHAPNIYG